MTVEDLVSFIDGADDSALDIVVRACNARRDRLRDSSAAALKAGTVVRLDGLSPKYLNGLTGTVDFISRGRSGRAKPRIAVALDSASQKTLLSRNPHQCLIGEYKNLLTGIPAECCIAEAA